MEVVNHIELIIPDNQARTVLRAILLSIFFHRALDAIQPDTIQLLDTHISCAPTPNIERDINKSIDDFAEEYLDQYSISNSSSSSSSRNKSKSKSGEMAVVFLQKKPKRGWFAVTEELVPWEEHLITLRLTPPQPSSTSGIQNQNQNQNPLPKALMQITRFCVEKKGNVPPLVGINEQNNLTYQILIAPPSPKELFAPSSPPFNPIRLTSPPPPPSSAAPAPAPPQQSYTNTITPRSVSVPTTSTSTSDQRRTISPSPPTSVSATGGAGGGYLEQAKDGLRAVSAKAGAGVGWGGRAVGAAFGRG